MTSSSSPQGSSPAQHNPQQGRQSRLGKDFNQFPYEFGIASQGLHGGETSTPCRDSHISLPSNRPSSFPDVDNSFQHFGTQQLDSNSTLFPEQDMHLYDVHSDVSRDFLYSPDFADHITSLTNSGQTGLNLNVLRPISV